MIVSFKSIAAVFIFSGTIGGGAFFIDDRFALDADLIQIGERLEAKIVSDDVRRIQDRVWAFDDRFGKNCTECDIVTKSEYRRMLQDMRELTAKLISMRSE